MPSSFIHAVVCIRISFLFKAEHCSVVRIYHILLIPSFISGYLDRFHVLAIVNHADMNTDVQISLRDSAFSSLGHIPRSRIVGSFGNSTF